MDTTTRTTIKIALFILVCISLTLTGLLTLKHIKNKYTVINAAHMQAQQETIHAAQQLDSFITELIPLVHSLSNELTTKKLSKEQIEERLQQKPVEISGFGVAFEPYAYDNKDRLYAPYYVEKDDKQQLLHLDSLYDYTQPEHTWYHQSLTKGPGFIDPYFGSISGTILAEYAEPFYATDKETGGEKPVGIVFANQTIEHLQHILSTLYLGQTGYWFLLANDGSFLSHPNMHLVKERTSIFDLAKKLDSEELYCAGNKAVQGESGATEYDNEITKKPSWLFFEQLPSTKWILCRVYDKDEVPLDKDLLRRQLMHIVLSAFASLLFIVLFFMMSIQKNTRRWWYISFTIATIFAATLGLLWYISWLYPDYKENLIPIRDKIGLYTFLDTHVNQSVTLEQQKANIHKLLTYRYKKGQYIPTGIFVSHLTFSAENQINIVCYIWQRYFDGIHDNVSRGFILPQATTVKKTELYRRKEAKTEVIIWQVKAVLNQDIIYQRYPFDVKDLQLQIWHQDFEKNIILVPDLDSYQLINPSIRPGLSPTVYFPGWSIKGSYFGYMKNIYNTVFGLYSYGPFGIYKKVEKSQTPELYFAITAQRYLFNILIADLLPIAVIALLLFVLLLTSVPQGYGILGSCATVFFGLLFEQIRFRTKIPSAQLVYFENFYLILYAMILAIVIVALLYLLKFNINFIQYKKNLIAKLLYWPIVLGFSLGITLLYLY